MAKQVQLINLFFLLAFLFIQSTSTTVVEARKCKSNTCSPPVTKRTKAIMTINDFQKGGDGGGPAECDNKYHSNNKPVVALSTGWFNKMKRCHKYIIIYANGRSVKAMVVDECDSTRGCKNNIVDASKAVWEALHVPKKDWGLMEVHWSDA